MVKASDIMTEDVATIRGSATVADAVRLMKLRELHSLIVERRTTDDAYGIVTDTDIASKVVAYGKDPKQVRVYEIMTKPCIVVNPDLAVEYVARLFAQTGIDRAPVIKNELVGIISTTDILTKGDFLENPRVLILEKALKQAISDARALTANQGTDSEEVATAWGVVNEIEAELAFCRGESLTTSSVNQFNSQTPDLVTA
ncbi:MAG: CBS domain-containing protein [Oculatellaceae cyanobacterium bins.114]|nr:CBS domain-containing protein [Oculatellaceae cyanobacterium bins.114]